jgi:mono/diheme cytochrome c family protein
MTRLLRLLRAYGTQLGIVAVLLAAAAGLFVYTTAYREEPAPSFVSDEEHFLFGSIGTEAREGVPYWVWLVLPRIFPEYLPRPGGYASLGILSVDGGDMPVGLSKATVGVPRVGTNCALCHTTSVRLAPGGPRMLVAGGPSNVTAPQQYLRFLVACASDPRFTADVILAEIARNYRLSAFDRLMYRFVVIPRTRDALLELKESRAWMDRNPDAGHGRVDFFNAAKFHRLDQPVDATIGTADMMPIWNVESPEGRAYGWDGNNTALEEILRASAVVEGASAEWLDRDFAGWDGSDPERTSSLRRILAYMRAIRPPPYPLAVDTALAERGAAVYRGACADCHAPGASRTGTVIPIEEIGTDRHRLVAWTPGSAEAYHEFGEGRRWAFSGFRTTDGYVAVPLEGLWLRAPYLHNGSVPTLADLLEPVEARPAAFWRGSDVFDAVKVGFVSEGPEAEAVGTRIETSRPGNSNGGHVYGTTLDAESKRALLEYLKTL